MSDEEAAPDSAAGDPVEHDPEQQSAGSIGRQIAAYGTLALAVVGATVFGLLSLGAAIAYSPLGVRPSEIGLGSAALLTQSAIAVVFAAAVFALGDLVLMYPLQPPFVESRIPFGQIPCLPGERIPFGSSASLIVSLKRL
jgi:hypothetical protein